MFVEGKFVDTLKFRKYLKELSKYNCIESIQNQISKLVILKWIIYNKTTGYFVIVSYQRLGARYNFTRKIAVQTYPEYLSNNDGYFGAVLYAYLYINYKRKEKTESFVSLKGDTYNNFPIPSSLFDNFKPVSTTGINKLFPLISISAASSLKTQAQKAGLLSVKKNYHDLNIHARHFKILQKQYKNVLVKDDKLFLQQIDTVLPHIRLKSRKNQ